MRLCECVAGCLLRLKGKCRTDKEKAHLHCRLYVRCLYVRGQVGGSGVQEGVYDKHVNRLPSPDGPYVLSSGTLDPVAGVTRYAHRIGCEMFWRLLLSAKLTTMGKVFDSLGKQCTIMEWHRGCNGHCT